MTSSLSVSSPSRVSLIVWSWRNINSDTNKAKTSSTNARYAKVCKDSGHWSDIITLSGSYHRKSLKLRRQKQLLNLLNKRFNRIDTEKCCVVSTENFLHFYLCLTSWLIFQNIPQKYWSLLTATIKIVSLKGKMWYGLYFQRCNYQKIYLKFDFNEDSYWHYTEKKNEFKFNQCLLQLQPGLPFTMF